MLYTLRFFFSSKCSLFHNANLFGSCIIHILYTVCAKIKKKKTNSGAKRVNTFYLVIQNSYKLINILRYFFVCINTKKIALK